MLERSIGSVFAGYRIDRVIGRGGMGVVYLATQVALDRLVALKLVAPELGAEATFRERFARELKFVAAIDHPNVIPVYDARRGGRDALHRDALRRRHRPARAAR